MRRGEARQLHLQTRGVSRDSAARQSKALKAEVARARAAAAGQRVAKLQAPLA